MRLAMDPRGRSICAMLGLLSLAGCMLTIVDMDERLAEEAQVLGAVIDRSLGPEAMRAQLLVLLHERHSRIDEQFLNVADRWIADSFPDVPRDLLADFRRVAGDTSNIVPFTLPHGSFTSSRTPRSGASSAQGQPRTPSAGRDSNESIRAAGDRLRSRASD